MDVFEYGDEEVSRKEIMLGTTSMVIGIGILTLPRLVATATQSSDGWMSIAIAGMLAIVLAWVAAKLASRFPKMSFITYTGLIVTKPVAMILSCVIFIYFFLFSAYVTRGIANIAKQYLFDDTPIEVIALVYILIVTYAVAGTRVGLLRLNMLFIPIVLIIIACLLAFSSNLVEPSNLKPFFVSSWSGILLGVKESIFSLLGFEVILFYISNMNRPQEAPKAVIIGMVIPVLLYLFVYLFVISVFSIEATREVIYPTIELAKEIVLPGEFFERFESLFFLIWIMTIFNTGSMAFDVCILAIGSLFKNVRKMIWIWIITPFVFIAAMMPQDLIDYTNLGEYISYLGLLIAGIMPISLLLIAIIRGVKGHS